MAIDDDVLPDGTHIPAGTWLVYSAYVMGRLEHLWGKDCLEYRPERLRELKERPSPFLFPAFQAGPRTCLGQNMAYMEMKVVLARVLTEFDLELEPGQKIEPEMPNPTLPMRYGMKVKVAARAL